LTHHEAVLLNLVEQLVALCMVQVAHVANFSETEVVVEASLASPVSYALLVLLLEGTVVLVEIILAVLVLEGVLDLSIGTLRNNHVFLGSHVHVFWLSVEIVVVLLLLASEAGLATLEVVVLTLGAFPTTFWEIEFI
jgi:hypothetical protein